MGFQNKSCHNLKFVDVFYLDGNRVKTYIFETKNKKFKARQHFEVEGLIYNWAKSSIERGLLQMWRVEE